ncbi:MAG: protein translocase subunit SecD, partial [Alphaproteobacteria bacterium]|nr:protein translocase subunit SecD [Alphaproteobacteria bacterium]
MLQFSGFKKTLVIMICLLGVLYASPNLIRSDFSVDLPTFAPGKKVSLGLDLQGGSYLLLQVDLNVVILEYLESITSSVRQQLRKSKIGYKGLGASRSSVVLKIRKKEDFEEAKELIRGIDQGNEVSMDASGNIRISPRENSLKDRKSAALQQSIEIVRRRIDETGVREPTIQRQGESRILVQLPGVDDPERVKALLGQTAKMVFRLVDVTTSASEAMAGRVPPGSELLEAALVEAGDPKAYVIKKRVMVSGEHLIDAQATFQDGQPVVSFRFDTSGAKRFGKVTTDNVNRPFAIVLDNEVISAPVIREPILGGTGIISGNFTVASANDLALLLRAGALPAPLTVLEERSVGPGLGVDSIAAGKLASLIGICLVIGFMILSYGLFGIFANIALFFNVTLIVGALSVLQATLTLPGIAGIVLTIGMA